MAKAGKIWFRRKRFGWGWTPVTIEGWATVLIYVVAVVSAQWWLDRGMLAYCGALTLPTALLIGVCWLKGEKPRWQWGDRDR